MKLCSWEIKKLIIQFKPFLALLFLLLAACVLFWQRASGEGDGGFVYAQYREIGADYRSGKLNWEEVKKNAESAEGLTDIRYTKNEWTEGSLYQVLYQECRQVREYPEFCRGLADGGTTFMGVGNRFYKRNMEKMARDYEKLKNIIPEFAGLYGVSLLRDTGKAEYCILFLVLLITAALFSQERQNQTGTLLYAAPKGRIPVGISKFAAGVFGVIVVVTIYSFFQIFAICFTYGIGDANSIVQAVPGFATCPYQLTVWQFLGGYVLVRMMAGLMLYSMFFLIQCVVRKGWLAVLLCSCLIVVCSVLKANIHPNSSAAILYYYNPVTMFDAADTLVGYHNGNVFGYPVSRLVLCIACQLGVFLCCGIASAMFFCTNLLLPGADSRNRESRHGRRFLFTLTGGEIFKCLAVQRGIQVYAVFLLLMLLFCPGVSDDLGNFDKVYYKNYIRRIEGQYSEEKMDTLREEKKELKREEEILDRGRATLEARDIITHELERRPALNKTIRYGKYLSEKKHASFVYSKGYLIFGGIKRGKIALWYNMIGILMSLFLAWLIAGIDFQTGMEQLIVVSAQGKRKINSVKRKTVAIITCTIVAMTQFIFLFTIGREYGFSGITATAQSIRVFSQLPSCIKLWHVMTVWIVVRYSIFLAFGQIVLALYGKCMGKGGRWRRTLKRRKRG